jgi:hypothetical protein
MAKKTRRKPKFRCHKCKKDLGSSYASWDHFQQYPTHRNQKQRNDYRANCALAESKGGSKPQRRASGGLPTTRITTRTRAGTMKFCTNCGERRMPSHNYCGGCGDKL